MRKSNEGFSKLWLLSPNLSGGEVSEIIFQTLWENWTSFEIEITAVISR